jgi:RNA polymerase sigma factor (sigma-70 family)
MQNNDGELRSRNEFIARNLRRMRRVALAVLRSLNFPDAESHVEDVVNETCLIISLNWNKLHSPDDAVNTITSYRARDYARNYRRRRESAGDIPEEAEPLYDVPGADPGERLMHLQLVQRLLAVLSKDQQTVILLKFFHGLTFKEIAAALDQPGGTVRARYSRALEKMRHAAMSPQLAASGVDDAPASEGKGLRREEVPQPESTWRGESHE